MIIGFSSNSTNSGGDPVLYLTAATRFDGTVRTPQPVVLRGDPGAMIEAINLTPFAHKYSSGWMSWAPGEKVSPERERQLMDEFENRVMFPGIAPANRPPTLWVRHEHQDRHEMHFLTPRTIFLRDADGRLQPKSINIAPPGDASKAIIAAFQELQNALYGWASPRDPARQRDVVLSVTGSRIPMDQKHIAPDGKLLETLQNRLAEAKTNGEKFRGTSRVRDDLRLAIASHLRREVDAGHIHDREGVITYLQEQGLTVRRTRSESITVGIPGLSATFPDLAEKDGCIRLQGGLFREEFDPSRPDIDKPGDKKKPIYGRPDPERATDLDAVLNRLTQARAEYNAKRYDKRVSPDNDNSAASFARTIARMVNSPVIGVDRHVFQGHLSSYKAKKRRRRIYNYNAATGQVWETWVEDELER